MYSPLDFQGSSSRGEWIELYNFQNSSINLTGWKLTDNKYTDELVCCRQNCSLTFPPYSYILILDKDHTFLENNSYLNTSNNSFIICVDDNSIGNGLGNTEDWINITDDDGSLILSIHYYSSWGALNTGETLEKIDPKKGDYNTNWKPSLKINGTPGFKNNIFDDGTISFDYSVLYISEFLADPKGDDNENMPEGEWVEIFNPSSQSIDLQGLFIGDESKKIVITDTNTIGSSMIKANSFKVIYPRSGKGLFNNNGLDYVKLYDKDENLINQVSYSDPKEGSSFAMINNIWQLTKPTPGKENINYSSVYISTFNISSIYDLGSDKKAKWGQTIRVRLEAYKGDESKNSLSLWVEDKDGDQRSKHTRFNIYNRYTENSITLPIQLYPNCNKRYKDGSHTVHIGWTSSLESLTSYTFNIEDISVDVCKDKEDKKENKKSFIYELKEFPKEIFPNKRFNLTVFIENNEKNAEEIELYSYVYRASKCYSGDREENKESFKLYPGESKEVCLENIIEDAKEGDYKLKVRIKKGEQKTYKELTNHITVTKEKDLSLKEVSSSVHLLSKNISSSFQNLADDPLRKVPITIFESKTLKRSDYPFYFLALSFSILMILLILKRL
jgi:hypothetical protein